MRRIKDISACFVLVAVLSFQAMASDKTFYRYIDDKGRKVMDDVVPPEYAQKGYEVINAYGQVIKVVPPAVSKEEAERVYQERIQAEKLAKWDANLKRRYSSVRDIEAAQQRKLESLEGNIQALRGNVTTLKGQLVEQQTRAASFQRRSQPIPEYVEKAIHDLEAELKSTESQIVIREGEYQKEKDRYEKDKARFIEISNRKI